MPDLPDPKFLAPVFAGGILAVAALSGCGDSTDKQDQAATHAQPIRFVGAPVAEGVFDSSTAGKRIHDVLQVVFRLDAPVAVSSKPVLIAFDLKSTYLSRYGTTPRCYSADIPIYKTSSALAHARSGDTLPITLKTRAGKTLASTTAVARPLVDRPTLYALAAEMACRRPSRAQTHPLMTLTIDGKTRAPRVVCINDNTERMRGAAVCNWEPNRAGILTITAGGRILIRVPGKIIGMALRDFDTETKNAPLLDALRPRRVRGHQNLWSARLPSHVDRKTNYLNVNVLLPRETYVTYEIKIRILRKH